MSGMHTPGPWKSTTAYIDIEVRTESYALVAVVTPIRCETEANASLIAAAPDLLEALMQMVACHDEPTCPAIDVAKAAIAKATGGAA